MSTEYETRKLLKIRTDLEGKLVQLQTELEDIKKRKKQSKNSNKEIDEEINRIQSHLAKQTGPEKSESPECEKVGDADRFGYYTVRPSCRPALLGLAFSGGGIRSATFNLGLLQALCNQGILENWSDSNRSSAPIS